MSLSDFPDKCLPHLFLVFALQQAESFALFVHSANPLINAVLILPDHSKRRCSDLFMAAVIPVKQDDRRCRIVPPKPLHTVGTCTPEAIDRLVVISHDKKIMLRSRQHSHNLILQRRYILKFIHQDVL